ncbi:caspase family protein [Pseudodesulfovibrio sp. zrk46]|uniref:caspase family protein n=1 Tax=Pseudodesulfovibrio sp. zrk46 TaxID=2725288 RepID=UPI001449B6AB|nr:caspase family protein [Pseudodesulfovibrio sp. zrk46]QJB55623.1 caspase family protein [Pseudodesulfovibrio sp. zrk46]
MKVSRFWTVLSLTALLLLSGCVTPKYMKETFVSSSFSDTSPGEASLYIEQATAEPMYKNRVSLSEITSTVAQGFQQMSARIVDDKDEADFVVATKVVKLSDLFDNVIDVNVEVKSTSDDKVVYISKFTGWSLTQVDSMTQITKGVYESQQEIFGSVNKHFEESGGKMAALPPAAPTTAFAPRSDMVTSNTSMATGARYALVIGNSAYPNAPLKNPVNDARDVVRSLRQMGFTVIQKNNAGLREMEMAMNTFYSSLQRGGVGLFYYAGHGVQVGGSNYLVPVDARINSESDVKYECLDAGRILGKMEDAGNSMNIIILDACRNNPFARSFRSASRGLARMDAPTGSILAFSTAPGSVAEDGSGRNGVYTKHLLQNLMTPGLDISDIFFYTRRGVVQETQGRQVPWESSSLVQRFYFLDK